MNDNTTPSGELRNRLDAYELVAKRFGKGTGFASEVVECREKLESAIAANQALSANHESSLPPIPLLRTGEVQIRDFTLTDMHAYAQAALAGLTAELDALRKDAERYRELRKGKALIVRCGNITIFTGPNPDCAGKYPEALDAAIDAAIPKDSASSAD